MSTLPDNALQTCLNRQLPEQPTTLRVFPVLAEESNNVCWTFQHQFRHEVNSAFDPLVVVIHRRAASGCRLSSVLVLPGSRKGPHRAWDALASNPFDILVHAFYPQLACGVDLVSCGHLTGEAFTRRSQVGGLNLSLGAAVFSHWVISTSWSFTGAICRCMTTRRRLASVFGTIQS